NPAATSHAPRPTAIRRVTRFDPGSMRASVPLPSFATHIAPAAATAPHGFAPVAIRAAGGGGVSVSPSATVSASGRRRNTSTVTPMQTERFLTVDDVYRARERIAGRLHRTPMLTSRTLTDLAGADIHFKAELLQRTGSFKPRGVLNKLATLSDDEKA